eukprot:365569-Heterocapsa_arctica.AAC.1
MGVYDEEENATALPAPPAEVLALEGEDGLPRPPGTLSPRPAAPEVADELPQEIVAPPPAPPP